MYRPLRVATGLLLTSVVAAQEGPPPALVTTAAVSEAAISETVTLLGTVRPVLDSLVACEVDGRVARRFIENGDTVARGAKLVELDASRLEQLLDQAISDKAEIEALLDLARVQEVRARELYRGDVLAQGDVDEAFARRQSLEARYRAVDVRIASIRDDVGRTTVRAPFDGVVTEIRTEVGEWIRQGGAVVRLAQLDPVEIRVDVPERQFPQLRLGAAAPATIESLPGLVLDGKITALVPLADSEARAFPVLVRAANQGGRVAAGMLARVDFTLSAGERAVLVPKDAIVRQARSESVFVVEDDVVRSVTIRSGRTSGERIEVFGDLEPGQQVVVRGNERLTHGARVRVDPATGG